ncbi:hypothetical protein [Citreimonas sp.]|uniref:hypothetical protein n=1 Tax=Citreimonas sp. TaxID=3036715 RepID=UPI0035C83E0C
MTNAAKYGALSCDGGRILIHVGLQDGAVVLTWTEMCVGAVPPPTREGYGTIVIRTAIETQLGGEVAREIGNDGMVYRFTFAQSLFISTELSE